MHPLNGYRVALISFDSLDTLTADLDTLGSNIGTPNVAGWNCQENVQHAARNPDESSHHRLPLATTASEMN